MKFSGRGRGRSPRVKEKQLCVSFNDGDVSIHTNEPRQPRQTQRAPAVAASVGLNDVILNVVSASLERQLVFDVFVCSAMSDSDWL